MLIALLACMSYNLQAAQHHCRSQVQHHMMTEVDRYERIRAQVNSVQQEMIVEADQYGKQEVCDCCGCPVTREQIGCASTGVAICASTFAALYCNLPVLYAAPAITGVAKIVSDCFKPDQEAKKAKLDRLRASLYS